MNEEKKSLGRGLDSLLGEKAERSTQGVLEVPVEDLVPGQYQPRNKMHKDTLDELSESIKSQGVLQPILARKKASKGYEIVVGERRWRAAQKAGLNEVPVIIKNFNEIEVLEIGLIENMQRENLSAIEEALGFEKLQKEYNYTQENLSKILSKSRAYVANALRLLSLPHKVQQLVQSGDLSSGHARALIVLADPLPVAKFAIKKGMSVRQLESYVSYLKKDKKSKQASVSQKSPDTLMLEKKLTDNLGLSVQIDEGKGEKGEIKIKYLSYDQLNFICDKLN